MARAAASKGKGMATRPRAELIDPKYGKAKASKAASAVVVPSQKLGFWLQKGKRVRKTISTANSVNTEITNQLV